MQLQLDSKANSEKFMSIEKLLILNKFSDNIYQYEKDIHPQYFEKPRFAVLAELFLKLALLKKIWKWKSAPNAILSIQEKKETLAK